jgi:hypothetical protein
MPKFDLPKMEMPDAFREMAEKGVAQAKDNYEKIQTATVEATELLKDAYTAAYQYGRILGSPGESSRTDTSPHGPRDIPRNPNLDVS